MGLRGGGLMTTKVGRCPPGYFAEKAKVAMLSGPDAGWATRLRQGLMTKARNSALLPARNRHTLQ